MRTVSLEPGFTDAAPASVLMTVGRTRVICAATLEEQVPRFLRGKGLGWLTAEYGMLPSATPDRSDREAARGKQGGRTVEIQRLIGRSLRQCVDLGKVGEVTIKLDCDVIQADGGTRTASITGACLAVHLLLAKLGLLHAFVGWIAGISVGIYGGTPILDLEYEEDSQADTDMNIVLRENRGFIEIQGTAENQPFSYWHLNEMLRLAEKGASELFTHQARVAGVTS